MEITCSSSISKLGFTNHYHGFSSIFRLQLDGIRGSKKKIQWSHSNSSGNASAATGSLRLAFFCCSHQTRYSEIFQASFSPWKKYIHAPDLIFKQSWVLSIIQCKDYLIIHNPFCVSEDHSGATMPKPISGRLLTGIYIQEI